ncbi:MAG: 3-dehydroquinate synthase [Halanaerobiaceae bacterium]
MVHIKEKIEIEIKEEELIYPILIGNNIIDSLDTVLNDFYDGEKIFLVTDENVNQLYGTQVMQILEENYTVIRYVVPAGEKAKSLQYLKNGYDRLVENNFHRDHLVLALGGGVVGDLAGYLAASYMRGIDLVQVPTTLLAQVDSSVGGKTAINHPGGKNLIGAFYQPQLVFIDFNFLETLPLREFKTGLAEVIKHGLIVDREFFSFLENNRSEIYDLEEEALTEIIKMSCLIKSGIVARDQKEKGERALLNFGHTLAHALEATAGYGNYTHGEAVAVGMKGEARLSNLLGFLDKKSLSRIENLLSAYELRLTIPEQLSVNDLYEAMWHDKKVKKSTINWVLLEDIGEAFTAGGFEKNVILEMLEGLK